jgi:phosphoribosylglycinamide formyltransferase-1
MKTRLTFLCSGGGGNLRLVHALARSGALSGVEVVSVIADRECGALEWARAQSIPAEAVTYTRSRGDALAERLVNDRPDVIVTTIHKILDAALVDRYRGRLVNLHYSLLPSFAGTIGMEPVRLAREYGCRVLGATAHLVTDDVDAGPILAQASFDDADSPLPVEDATFRCGGIALAAAIESVVRPSERPGGRLVAGALAVIASPFPPPAAVAAMAADAFWEALR